MALTKIGKEGVTGISNSSDATAITIDSSENVGIGTASPTKKVSASIGLNDTDGYVLEYSGEAKGGILLNPASGEVRIGAINSSGTYLPTFYSNNSEAMRLTSGGDIAFGNTVANTVSGYTNQPGGGFIASDSHFEFATTSNRSAVEIGRNNTNVGDVVTFRKQGTTVGSISVAASSTAYNTSSDYRLKTAVNYDWDATTRLKQLRPARFEWIAEGDDAVPVDGFLAHEVQTVVPEAISGTHDEVDDEGNPVYQGIDQSKLVPLLVKTIQELEARITALETA